MENTIKESSPIIEKADQMSDLEQGLEFQPQTEETLVTGFRESLGQALDLRRNAVNARESIVAQDIGKMPDLNIAESIQRIGGVAITREGGEGR